jgi:hypothetical protein
MFYFFHFFCPFINLLKTDKFDLNSYLHLKISPLDVQNMTTCDKGLELCCPTTGYGEQL